MCRTAPSNIVMRLHCVAADVDDAGKIKITMVNGPTLYSAKALIEYFKQGTPSASKGSYIPNGKASQDTSTAGELSQQTGLHSQIVECHSMPLWVTSGHLGVPYGPMQAVLSASCAGRHHA